MNVAHGEYKLQETVCESSVIVKACMRVIAFVREPTDLRHTRGRKELRMSSNRKGHSAGPSRRTAAPPAIAHQQCHKLTEWAWRGAAAIGAVLVRRVMTLTSREIVRQKGVATIDDAGIRGAVALLIV